MADATATLTSDIDSTPIGTVVFAGPGTSPTATIDYVRGATYSLLDTFLITLNGHPLNDPPSTANITITSTVTPSAAAEPWNCAIGFVHGHPSGVGVFEIAAISASKRLAEIEGAVRFPRQASQPSVEWRF